MNIGAQLRTSREARGLSIAAVAHTTRVQPRILAAIEQNDIAVVPPRPFGRGFVRAYARELGLDPEQTTREYFGQFAPPAPPAPPPDESDDTHASPWNLARSQWALIAAGAVAALIIGMALRAPSPAATAPPSPAAVGTSGTATPAPASGDEAASGARGAAEVSPPAAMPAAKLTIVLSASRPSWVSARSDGRRSLYQFVTPGSPQTLTGTQDIQFRVGDAGALRWTINGRDAGALGRSGQVRDVRVTPATAATAR